jgi:hypothetical protein
MVAGVSHLLPPLGQGTKAARDVPKDECETAECDDTVRVCGYGPNA